MACCAIKFKTHLLAPDRTTSCVFIRHWCAVRVDAESKNQWNIKNTTTITKRTISLSCPCVCCVYHLPCNIEVIIIPCCIKSVCIENAVLMTALIVISNIPCCTLCDKHIFRPITEITINSDFSFFTNALAIS